MQALQRIENYLYDVRVEFMMPRVVDPRVVIVDIDEASLDAEGQWPWPRDKVAALVDALFDDYGIRTLGFDARRFSRILTRIGQSGAVPQDAPQAPPL